MSFIMSQTGNRLTTWLQLLRAPNLLTVPGDPLAGFLLVAGFLNGNAALAVMASLAFYATGLLLNDVFDAKTDAAERPERPIPSGRASRREVSIAAGVLAAGALAICALGGAPLLITGVALLSAIVLYDAALKNHRVLGPASMGLCRGLNVLLGASAAGSLLPAAAAAAVIGLYIAAVTSIARDEMSSRTSGGERWLPALVILAGFVIMFAFDSDVSRFARIRFAAVLLPALIACVFVAVRLPYHAAEKPRLVGVLISLLLLLQAAFALLADAGSAGSIAAAALVALWPVNRRLNRTFYSS